MRVNGDDRLERHPLLPVLMSRDASAEPAQDNLELGVRPLDGREVR